MPSKKQALPVNPFPKRLRPEQFHVDLALLHKLLWAMIIWIVTSICILLVTITALVKVKAFFGKVFLIILGLVALIGAFLAHDQYDALMATAAVASPPAASPTADSLATAIANQRHQLDSLNVLYGQMNTRLSAITHKHDSLKKVTDKLASRTKTSKGQLSPGSGSSPRLGARLGESIPLAEGGFQRIDIFSGMSPGDIRNASIHIRFDKRFDMLVIKQDGPGSVAGACPEVDSVYSASTFDYECDLLANGTGIVVTTLSEIPLTIVDIDIQPK